MSKKSEKYNEKGYYFDDEFDYDKLYEKNLQEYTGDIRPKKESAWSGLWDAFKFVISITVRGALIALAIYAIYLIATNPDIGSEFYDTIHKFFY